MRRFAYWIMLTAVLLSSCATGPGSTAIHDTPSTGVWLTQDPLAASGHNHPYSMTADAMMQVLSGVQVEERDTLTGLGILGSKTASRPSIGRRLRCSVRTSSKRSGKLRPKIWRLFTWS
jgi:hypothetical protein